MKWFVAVVCVCTFVSADPYCEQASTYPESPPDPLADDTVPIQITGLLAQVFRAHEERFPSVIQTVRDQKLKNNQNLVEFFRKSGGPGFNVCLKIQYFKRQTDQFWQGINDLTKDTHGFFVVDFQDAISIIEKQFSLVINQPLVRSWVRELRDIPRIALNLSFQRLQHRHSQWSEMVQQVRENLTNLVRTFCNDPDTLQDRYYRVLRISFEEATDIINQFFADLIAIKTTYTQRVYELTKNIYEVEILALKYFVS